MDWIFVHGLLVGVYRDGRPKLLFFYCYCSVELRREKRTHMIDCYYRWSIFLPLFSVIVVSRRSVGNGGLWQRLLCVSN